MYKKPFPFIYYLKPQKLHILWLTFSILGGIALDLLNPQIVGSFIDHAVARSPINELTTIAFLFLAVAVGSQAVSLLVTYLGQKTAWTATNALRVDLVSHVLQLNMAFHKAHTPGELIERIDGDVTELANLFSQAFIRLFANGLLILGILVVLFRVNAGIGLIGTAYIFLAGLALRQIQKPATRSWGEARQANAELFGYMGERLAGAEDIRANGGIPHVMDGLYRLTRTLYQKHLRAYLTGSLTFITGYSAYTVALIAIFGISASLCLKSILSIGTVYLMVSYVNKLEAPLQEIQKHVADLQRAAASVGRVNVILQMQSDQHSSGERKLSSGPLSIAFENVSFGYPDALGENDAGNGNVLSNITFNLAAGRVLGLLGRTGSGKTTLARLLLRLYDADPGIIRLGDIDLREVALHELRRRIGMVTQEVQIFEASVRDNLTLFNRKISDEQILSALPALGLETWFRAMPEGLDTILKSGAQNLSAGEGQLLALVRIFLRNPDIVVMDEASSRLDPATDRLLEQAMSRIFKGRTVVIIAHRLQTVQHADDILILEGGRIQEYGERRRLLNDPASRFSHLLQVGLEEVMK